MICILTLNNQLVCPRAKILIYSPILISFRLKILLRLLILSKEYLLQKYTISEPQFCKNFTYRHLSLQWQDNGCTDICFEIIIQIIEKLDLFTQQLKIKTFSAYRIIRKFRYLSQDITNTSIPLFGYTWGLEGTSRLQIQR